MARLRDAAPSAVHALASLLRRRRRGARAAVPPRSHAVGARGVLPCDGHRCARARRVERPAVANSDTGALYWSRSPCSASPVRLRSASARPSRGATGCSSSSGSGRSSCPPTTSSSAFHTDWGFALCWGAFPALTAYFVEAQTLRLEAFAAAGYAFLLSLAQRTLSTPVRDARRTYSTTVGTQPLERALQLLVWASTLVAVALVAARLR